ncbi:hypothetical protein G5B47_10400 [Paenibacillus sp. 7124]|uniref:Uncharacterized protein n=1 Tax=Paenibacillus apii TaxID=1850370 RepID=A0A6M1PLV2_9BACL|nr:hypothetical protein [Paenibacillus apii]NGM82823.1 hypothetical protein [Paenibacillus apii]NJJ39963.1 hypothetical protein [Paenibacillus apii]
MRNIAVAILVVIMASIVIEPLVELANVFREKVTVGSAVSGALRAARDRSLEDELLRELDARVDEERFKEYFADSFGDALHVSESNDAGDEVTFTSDDGKFNPFTVSFVFDEYTDLKGRIVTEVIVKAESQYKFKTKYLKLAESAGNSGEYKLVSEQKYLLSVRN